MKRGEKVVLWAVFAIFAVMAGVIVYMESRYNQKDEQSRLGPANIDVVKVIPPNLTQDLLPEPDSKGAKKLAFYCVQCHELPPPSMHSPQGWQIVLSRMVKHMNERRGGVLMRVIVPGERDLAVLTDYLAKHGQQPLNKAAYDDLDSPEAKVFIKTCSQCHTAPDPAQHTAKEWQRVLVRMNLNMEKAGRTAMDTQTRQDISSYLIKHSRSNES